MKCYVTHFIPTSGQRNIDTSTDGYWQWNAYDTIRRGGKNDKARELIIKLIIKNRWGTSALLAPFSLISQFHLSCQRCKDDSEEYLGPDLWWPKWHNFVEALPQKRRVYLTSACTLECLFLGTGFCSFTYSLYPGILQLIAFFWEGTTVTLWSFIIFYHYSHTDNYLLCYCN